MTTCIINSYSLRDSFTERNKINQGKKNPYKTTNFCLAQANLLKKVLNLFNVNVHGGFHSQPSKYK